MPKCLVPCNKGTVGQIVASRKATDEMHSGAVFFWRGSPLLWIVRFSAEAFLAVEGPSCVSSIKFCLRTWLFLETGKCLLLARNFAYHKPVYIILLYFHWTGNSGCHSLESFSSLGVLQSQKCLYRALCFWTDLIGFSGTVNQGKGRW